MVYQLSKKFYKRRIINIWRNEKFLLVLLLWEKSSRKRIKGANWYQKVVGHNRRGQEFRGSSDNCSQEPTFVSLFLPWTGASCLEFSGQGRKSGGAYARTGWPGKFGALEKNSLQWFKFEFYQISNQTAGRKAKLKMFLQKNIYWTKLALSNNGSLFFSN